MMSAQEDEDEEVCGHCEGAGRVGTFHRLCDACAGTGKAAISIVSPSPSASVLGKLRFPKGLKHMVGQARGPASAEESAALAEEGRAGEGTTAQKASQAVKKMGQMANKAKKKLALQMSHTNDAEDLAEEDETDAQKHMLDDTGGDRSAPDRAKQNLTKWAKSTADKAKSTAEKAKKQLTKGGEVAHKGIEKAKSLEASSGGLGGLVSSTAEHAREAAEKAQQKAKEAQEKAKDFQHKGSEKIGAATSKMHDKTKAAAGAAKGKLKKAGGKVKGLGALAMSPKKLATFAGVFLLGMLLISMSLPYLPMLPVAPQRFSLLFAFGSGTIMGSLAILKGPKAFGKDLVKKNKLPFSGAYSIGLLGTLVATIMLRSFFLTAVFGLMQVVGLLYFLASYVPGGRFLLNKCGNCCHKCASRTART